MDIKTGYIYIVSGKYFDDFKDYDLKYNKNGRATLLAIQDMKNKDIFWAVPRSSQIEKYRSLYNKFVQKNGKCDRIYIIGKYAYLIQDTFPVTREYIDHAFTKNSNEIFVSEKHLKSISYSLKKGIAMAFNGKSGIFFTDVVSIYNKLIKK